MLLVRPLRILGPSESEICLLFTIIIFSSSQSEYSRPISPLLSLQSCARTVRFRLHSAGSAQTALSFTAVQSHFVQNHRRRGKQQRGRQRRDGWRRDCSAGCSPGRAYACTVLRDYSKPKGLLDLGSMNDVQIMLNFVPLPLKWVN